MFTVSLGTLRHHEIHLLLIACDLKALKTNIMSSGMIQITEQFPQLHQEKYFNVEETFQKIRVVLIEHFKEK